MILIWQFVKRMQQVSSKIKFNMPLMAIHLFMMALDSAMRVTGNILNYG